MPRSFRSNGRSGCRTSSRARTTTSPSSRTPSRPTIGIYARDDYYFDYHSDAFKKIMDELNLATDPAERSALIGDIQKQIADDAVNVFLFELPKLGVWNAKIKGLWAELADPGERPDRGPLGGMRHAATGAGASPAPRPVTARSAWHPSSQRGSASLVATLVAASIVIFLVMEVLPGDPASFMLGLNAEPGDGRGAAPPARPRPAAAAALPRLDRRLRPRRFRHQLHLPGAGCRTRSPSACGSACRWR